MSLLNVKSLTLTRSTPLFADLDFTLDPGDRLAVIAPNGRGKTTLLACLAGQAEAQAGEITRARGLALALVAQDVPDRLLPLTLREAVADGLPVDQGDWDFWRVDVALDDLFVPQDLRDTALGALSGGWQRTALLARAAVGEPDLYLLDEPTNHLDLSRIGVLTRWLAARPRDVGVILTSHDRAFLDQVSTRSLFLRPAASRLFALPYTRARAALDEADEADARRFENDLAKADQLRRQAAKLKNIGINSGSDLLVVKTKQLTQRAEKIEAQARAAHKDGSAGAIRLSHSASHAKALVSLIDAQVTTPDGRALFRTGEKWIERGDRVVVLGANGTGKSRLLAAVLAAIRAPEGAAGPIRAASSLTLGLSDQELTQLPDKATPFDLVSKSTQSDATARSLMAGAGIGPDWQGRPVAKLSGGQKSRLALLLLRQQAPNFYLLDEPTNHLDIEGQEALRDELQKEGATCLLVSHDRAFVAETGTRFWEIRGRRLEEVEGPGEFFRRALEA